MIETRPLNGVIPVVQTPIDANGSIDEKGLRRHMDFLGGLDTGGFWGLGTGSEDMNLTFEKRLQAARVLTEANAGRKPLILGAGFYALEEIRSCFLHQTRLRRQPRHPVRPIQRGWPAPLLWPPWRRALRPRLPSRHPRR